jgi:ATP-dependent DNA helicase RecG
MQDTMQDTMQVGQLVKALDGIISRDELQEKLKINNRDYFRKAYIKEVLQLELIVMTMPDKPNSRLQKYRLTEKGKTLKKQLKK